MNSAVPLGQARVQNAAGAGAGQREFLEIGSVGRRTSQMHRPLGNAIATVLAEKRNELGIHTEIEALLRDSRGRSVKGRWSRSVMETHSPPFKVPFLSGADRVVRNFKKIRMKIEN